MEWWCVQKCCHYEINHIISRRRPSTSPVSPLCCHWKYLLFCLGLSADHMVTPSAGTGVFGGAMMKASRRGEWGSDEGRKEDPRLSFREEGREWGVLSSSINFQMSVAKNSLPPPPARAHTHTHTPPSLTNTRRIARTHIDAPLLTSPCARSHCQLGLQLYLCKSCIMPPPTSFPPRRHTYTYARTVPLRRTHAPNKKVPTILILKKTDKSVRLSLTTAGYLCFSSAGQGYVARITLKETGE